MPELPKVCAQGRLCLPTDQKYNKGDSYRCCKVAQSTPVALAACHQYERPVHTNSQFSQQSPMINHRQPAVPCLLAAHVRSRGIWSWTHSCCQLHIIITRACSQQSKNLRKELLFPLRIVICYEGHPRGQEYTRSYTDYEMVNSRHGSLAEENTPWSKLISMER